MVGYNIQRSWIIGVKAGKITEKVGDAPYTQLCGGGKQVYRNHFTHVILHSSR